MAEGILFCIAEEVLMSLASKALNDIALAWRFKDRLEKLKITISTIKDVLLDAEQRQADSHAIRGWLQRLSNAVYAADDLFDEVATIASRKQLMGGNRLTKEVRTFFSSSNQVAFAFSISQKIKTIRVKLDDIVKVGTEFTFAVQPREEGSVMNITKGRDQTYSFVNSEEVIGRESDKQAILDLLLSSDDAEKEVLHVIPIVGIGGLGKTTLVKLIYDDPRVRNYFELRLWVCVSEVFDIKVITEKILKSATQEETKNLEMEQLQGQLRKQVGDKRYLLILDDVWNEDRNQWLKLQDLLRIGKRGSKILVTTRSREVAKITALGSIQQYELQGLSEDKSWELFQKMAFEPGQAESQPHLMEIGKEIIKKCANVPLAIRSLGSLLYGKSEIKWLSVKDKALASICESPNDITNILKLSYNNLSSPLKHCFAYCALFTKDFVFSKETLIELWMAEGFIVLPDPKTHSLRELGEEYFSTLLQRCFFQDIKKDWLGTVQGCKMHDLIHDLAQEVAGSNCQILKSEEEHCDNRIRHVSFDYHLSSQWKIPNSMLNLKVLRTFLLPKHRKDGSPLSKAICQQIISSFSCLRVLDLSTLGVQSLPSSIGQLIHLRYLDLSLTPIKELPKSTTKLLNLQTLKLSFCFQLQMLPTNFRTLTNLTSLDIRDCLRLTQLPPGIGELTSLYKLPLFPVNNEESLKSRDKPPVKLSDLKNLNGLSRVLWIRIKGKFEDPIFQGNEANLSKKQMLTELRIHLGDHNYEDVSSIDHDEALLEGLKPHPNLRKLEIFKYEGQKLPSWAMKNNLCMNLPNLAEIRLVRCSRCRQVPSFAQLPFLKCLHLIGLKSVEYIEMESSLHELCLSDLPSTESPFFPSLKELMLMDMDSLKGWWEELREDIKEGTKEAPHVVKQRLLSMSFSNLSILWIQECPKLIFLPPCPNVEELKLVHANETLSLSKMAKASSSTSDLGSVSKLKRLTTSNVNDLIALPRECLHQVSSLTIRDRQLVSTEKLGETFTNLSSSLRTLEFIGCESLTYISVGLEHLTALKKLVFWKCEQLKFSPNEQLEDSNMPWKAFKSSLLSLTFQDMPKLECLPSGVQHLTSLHFLHVKKCNELMELPEWISCLQSLKFMDLWECHKLTSLTEGFLNLTTLNELQIIGCPGLTERCQRPTGRDWPKIKHIPLVVVLESPYS